MKRFLLIAVAAMLVTTSVVAQENRRRQNFERPDEATMLKMRTERMAKEYGLDEAQTEKLLELNKKYPNVMRGPGMGGPGMGRPDGNGNGRPQGERPQLSEEQIKEMQATREAYEKELKAIFTEEQLKAYEANKERRPGDRGNDNNGRRRRGGRNG